MKKLFLCTAPLWSLMLHAGVENSLVEKPIVVIIPSYNNATYVEKNLNSVYDQEYDNYRVVYVDDDSKDKTLAMVQDIVARRGQEHRTTIIHNDHNCGAMANFYHVIHEYCDTWDIVVQLDGDDALKHNKVLARVNQEYSEHDVWLTNGRYVSVPQGKNDDQRRYSPGIIQRCAYREVEKVPSHLRTCYAGLFKHVRLQDFLYQGNFLRMTCDMAIMFPLLEMAGNHSGFIDEILYEYNCTNPINDFKKDVILQLHLNHVLRARDKYQPLASLEIADLNFEPDVFILVHHNQDKEIPYCKEDLKQNIKGLGAIKEVSRFIDTEIFLNKLEASSADFIFIVDATCCCKKPFDITLCTQLLAQTQAHIFCCDLGMNDVDDILKSGEPVPPLVVINNAIYGWQLCMAEGLWKVPFGVRAHIYTKKRLQEAVCRIKGRYMIELFDYLNTTLFDYESVGLCGKEPFLGESNESFIRCATKIEENF